MELYTAGTGNGQRAAIEKRCPSDGGTEGSNPSLSTS